MAILIFSWFTSIYKSLKQNYRNKSPKEKWLSVRNIGIIMLKCVGVPILDPKFKVDWYCYTSAVIAVDYFSLMAYTIFYYAHDPLRALQSTCVIGIVVPSLLLYWNSMMPSRAKIYQSLAFFAGDYIYKTDKLGPSYDNATDESAIKLLRSTISIESIVFLSLMLFCVFPLYAFFCKNVYPMPIGIILPFVEPETQRGYLINMTHQLAICIIGVTAQCGIEIITCILKNTVWAIAIIVCHSLEELDKSARNERKFHTDTLWKFRNCVIQVQDFDRYVLILSNLYYWKFFLQPILLVYSVSMSIFLYFYGDWISGLGSAACCYTQMFILCDVGNEVRAANALMMESFYKIQWHLMPVKYQHMIGHIIRRLQNGARVKMGPLEELNYETATKLSRIIYSILMMMIRLTSK